MPYQPIQTEFERRGFTTSSTETLLSTNLRSEKNLVKCVRNKISSEDSELVAYDQWRAYCAARLFVPNEKEPCEKNKHWRSGIPVKSRNVRGLVAPGKIFQANQARHPAWFASL